MRPLLVCLAACALVALPLYAQMPPPGAALPDQAPPQPPVGRMYAMRASGAVPQQAHLDDALKPVAPMLKSLPFTSYEKVSIEDNVLPWGQETLFPINALYAMHVTPLAQEEDGAIALRSRVEMLQGEDYVNALDTVAHAVQNQALLFRGMPLGRDELVIVLLISLPSEQGEQGEASKEDMPEPGEQEQESDAQQEEEQDRQDAEAAEERETSPPEPAE